MRLKTLVPIFLACSALPPATAHEAEPGYRKGQIHAVQTWARINPVKGRPGAVFFTLHNESKVADALIKISTPIAKRAEMHSHIETKDGVMKMVQLQSIPVPPDDMVLFEPAGYHVMLFDMAYAPKAGTTFPLTLTFAKGKPQTIQVQSKGLVDPAPMPVDHSKMSHGSHP